MRLEGESLRVGSQAKRAKPLIGSNKFGVTLSGQGDKGGPAGSGRISRSLDRRERRLSRPNSLVISRFLSIFQLLVVLVVCVQCAIQCPL